MATTTPVLILKGIRRTLKAIGESPTRTATGKPICLSCGSTGDIGETRLVHDDDCPWEFLVTEVEKLSRWKWR